MTYPKMKPCPKCGEETFVFGYEGCSGGISSWRVECDPCGYIGSCEGRKLDAIREHNRRVSGMTRDPRRCATNIVTPQNGDCLHCGAANGEACRDSDGSPKGIAQPTTEAA